MGSVRQRPDGRWEARYTTPDGRQRSVYAKSEAEVTKKLRAALHDIDSGSWLEPSKMSVGDWLDVWLKDYQGHTTGRTLETYAHVVNICLRFVVIPVYSSRFQAHFLPVIHECIQP